jgi:hypothetical protein
MEISYYNKKLNKMFSLIILTFTATGLFSVFHISDNIPFQNANAATFHKDQTLAIGCDVHIFIADYGKKMDEGYTWELVCGEVHQYKCDDCNKIHFPYDGRNAIYLRCAHDNPFIFAKPITLDKGETELVKCEE